MKILVSFLPILLPFLFLVVLKMTAKKGMLLSFIIVLVGAFFVWDMELITLLASMLQGLHTTIGILIILFGAVFMMNTLKLNGAIDRINLGFNNLSTDMRIQTIMVAFLFGALIEGVAGFGTPAVVVAPLLVALGFHPLAAATVALVSNSVPVPFAAVGTPVQIGLQNINTTLEFQNEIAGYITSIDFLSGIFMPTIVVYMLIFFFGKNSSKKDYLEILPWTLFIGLTYVSTAFIMARTLGFEFVTIGTVIVMLVVSTLSVRFKFLVPKNPWRGAMHKDIIHDSEPKMSLLLAWSPYVLVIILLLMTRVIPPLKSFTLNFIDLSYRGILGIDSINSKLQLLYSPGFILILSAILAVFIQKQSTSNIKDAAKTSFDSIKSAGLVLIPTLAMVQIFSNSGLNLSNIDSMPVYLASYLGEYLNGIWYHLAPFIGELGSFITGSATVSTLTFSPVQEQIALQYGLNPELVLSIGLMGGAAGNMICVHNVVSVATVVGEIGKEGEIIKKTIFPAIIYAILIGLAAIILF